MAIEIFNRRENKYRLTRQAFEEISREAAARLNADKYNRSGETYPILNIYYDTETSDFIRTSLAKPAYKEKLRLRSYGVPDENSIVYAEIKKKVRGVVNKRRSGMKLSEAYEFLHTGKTPEIQPYMNAQVLNEIAYILARKPMKPMLFLSYERLAYFGDRGLRISFDRNIRTRREDLRLEGGVFGQRQLNGGEWIMEIKTAESIPLWLSKLLAENGVRPVSYSKYGEEYKQYRGERSCSSQYSWQTQASAQSLSRGLPPLSERRSRLGFLSASRG